MLDFEQLEARDQGELPYACYDRWLSLDGEDSLLFHRTDNGFLLRFLGRADFILDLEARRLVCVPVPHSPDEMLADLHFNQVLPLILGHDGDLVLHASAVKVDGGAVAFLGPTGRGKSTLAALLARAGHPFLTDDGLILDSAGQSHIVRPRRPILRLRPDSEAALLDVAESEIADRDFLKTRISARPSIPFCEEPVPLLALYVLIEPRCGAQTGILPIPPNAALRALISHSFILDVEDHARMRAHFDRLAKLARDAPCFSLDYPREYGALPSVIKTVIDHANVGVSKL